MSYLPGASWRQLGDHTFRTVRIFESMLWCALLKAALQIVLSRFARTRNYAIRDLHPAFASQG